MGKSFDFYSQKYLRRLFVSMTIVLLGIVFWSLDKGIVMLDEAFYLLHFQEGAHPLATSNWLQLASPFYTGDLYSLRISVFLAMSISAFLLGFTLSKYFKLGWPPAFTGVLAVFYQFVLAMPVQYVPNNATLNLFLINISLIFFFSAFLSNPSKLPYFSYLFLSGLSLGFVPFAMITNLPLLGLFAAIIFLTSHKKQTILSFFCWFAGLLAAVFIYFVFLQDWDEYIRNFKEAVEFAGFMTSHGVKPLLKWHYQLVIHFTGVPLVVAILNVIIAKNPFKDSLSKIIILVLTGSCVLFLVGGELFSPFGIFTTTVFYSMLLSLIWMAKEHFVPWKREYWFLVFLLLIPYSASLGTDVPFQVRSISYFPFTFVLMLILIKKTESRYFQLFLASLSCVLFLNFLTYPFRDGWARFKLIEQTHAYELPHGQGSIKLDKVTMNALQSLEPYINANNQVLISSVNQWGLVYLLGSQVPVLNFWPNETYTTYFLEKNNTDKMNLILLEGKYNPFSENFKKEFFEGKEMQTIKTGEFTLYKF